MLGAVQQQWGNMPPAPAWQQAPVPVRRPGSGWAVSGIVVACAGFAAAAVGAVVALLALGGSGLVFAWSAGEAGGHGRLAADVTRIGLLAVVLPLAMVAAVCTTLAWVRTRGPGRSRATTIVATVFTSCLLFLALLTAAVVT
jgi:hypothetical protein